MNWDLVAVIVVALVVFELLIRLESYLKWLKGRRRP